jgi:hypothetical protein
MQSIGRPAYLLTIIWHYTDMANLERGKPAADGKSASISPVSQSSRELHSKPAPGLIDGATPARPSVVDDEKSSICDERRGATTHGESEEPEPTFPDGGLRVSDHSDPS